MKSAKRKTASNKIQRVLLTGATGRLGSLLVPALLHRGYKVRVIVRNPAALIAEFPKHWQQLETVRVDLANTSVTALEEVCKDCQAVIHAAGLIHGKAKDLFALNAGGTTNLAVAARRARVGRFILVSSVAVYRRPRRMPVDEAHPYSFVSAYGKSKALGEQVVKESGLPYIILRPSAIYGPSFEYGFESVVHGIQKGRMPIIGKGDNRIPLVYEDDVVSAVLQALESKQQNKEYNIIGDDLWTQQQLFHEVARLLGVRPPRKHLPKIAAAAMAAASEVIAHMHGHTPKMSSESVAFLTEDRDYSNSKAKRELNWKPRFSMAEGLKRTVEALRA